MRSAGRAGASGPSTGRSPTGSSRPSGPTGALVRRVHQTISRGAYGGVGGAMSLTSRLAGDLVARRGPPVGRELSPRRLGGGLIGVIDGLIGDELEREGERAPRADGGPRRRPDRQLRTRCCDERVPGRDEKDRR